MATKADFIGFEFAGVHSSDLNIVRVSDGDRFEEELIPEVKDITVEVPGMHGEYFFGSTYGTRTFSVKIAFDALTEEQLRKLKRVYGRRQIGELIFDECPYKRYMAKIESPIELSYICFDEPKKRVVGTDIGDERYGVRWITHQEVDPETEEIITPGERERIYPYEILPGTQRIYKGEGTLSFKAYFPFAKSKFKVLPAADIDSDWAVSSGIMTAAEYAIIDKYIPVESIEEGESTTDWSNGTINIYNAGDLSTGFRLYLPAAALNQTTTLTYKARALQSESSDILVLSAITLKNGDIGILVDTNSELVIGVSEFGYNQDGNAVYKTSGNLYNKYITSGYFFKFEPNDLKTDGATLEISGGAEGIEIFYDYLYF